MLDFVSRRAISLLGARSFENQDNISYSGSKLDISEPDSLEEDKGDNDSPRGVKQSQNYDEEKKDPLSPNAGYRTNSRGVDVD